MRSRGRVVLITVRCPLCGHDNPRRIEILTELASVQCTTGDGGCGAWISIPVFHPS